MTRRKWLAVAAAGFSLLAALGLLESQCILSGRWKGEAFWRGRPSSYWLRQARAYGWILSREHFPIEGRMLHIIRPRPYHKESWLDLLDNYLPEFAKLRDHTKFHLPEGSDS
ncbi:hypothetical protein L7N99_22610, partial [Escherichia coli]|uniref:hypothetical protein n=1 Tax=Escherichia coli TaxID=562 RepID=UPI002ED06393